MCPFGWLCREVFAYEQGAKNDDVSDGKAICPSDAVALATWGEHVERITGETATTELRAAA